MFAVVSEAEVCFEDACLGRLGEKRAHIHDGDQRKDKEYEQHPGLLLGRCKGVWEGCR